MGGEGDEGKRERVEEGERREKGEGDREKRKGRGSVGGEGR